MKDPDGLYELLVRVHEGLTEEQSRRLNAKLILLLAAQVDDDATVRELVMKAASGTLDRT